MPGAGGAATRNVALYPWFKAAQSLLFWQATWFLYFQQALTPAQAILLYAVYDLSATLLEVPSGVMSDRLGRRVTLIVSALSMALGAALLGWGGGFAVFMAGQALLGAGIAFVSGTDSSFLYESLQAAGEEASVEAEELRAWRFSFGALLVSAPLGGLAALWSLALPFWLSAAAAGIGLVLALRFTDPPQLRSDAVLPQTQWGALRAAFRDPVLIWLFALAALMYGYSHLPFIFGQPFIEGALARFDLSDDAPLVSGTITAIMMGVSLLASLAAPRLRARIGLAALLLLAFGMQIALISTLALTGSVLAILALTLRMVPDAFSRPFILAHIQPRLEGAGRATYLSIQSLVGRLLFAASLYLAAGGAQGADALAHDEIALILGAYALFGLGALVLLALTARRSGV
ncbi:Predicted arabinose efflux permease, MFS family [Roseivivax lentus]|uniref:Predicted arabinose efflux permease, MFS family n=2 Tax=Roseivivax lentus TaxID=633194 RepID=A0A1N7PW68_9RHOB|nr:Predicted arabinose efflux permease, MFS family [Roseivivax lentus]